MNSEDWKKSKKKQPAMYNDWVYDPTKRLDTVDCGYYGLCRYLYNVIMFSKCPKCVIQLHLYMQELYGFNVFRSYWSGKRFGNMAFSPPKAIRYTKQKKMFVCMEYGYGKS